MNRKTVVAVLIVGVLLAGGLFLAFQTSTAEAATNAISTVSNLVGMKGDIDPEALAEALGISLDELTEARAVAVENLIDKAVELGFITQDDADELSSEEQVNRRVLHKYFSLAELAELKEYQFLLDALNITEEIFEAAVESVQQEKLADAVAEGKLTQEQADAMTGWRALKEDAEFNAAIKDAYTEAIEEALEDGTITQDQADALLSKLEDAKFNFFDGALKRGRHQRQGCGERMRFGGDSTQDTPLDKEGAEIDG